jgi:hypothetical protein
MSCPRCDGLVAHEYLLDPREGLVWQVTAYEGGVVCLL